MHLIVIFLIAFIIILAMGCSRENFAYDPKTNMDFDKIDTGVKYPIWGRDDILSLNDRNTGIFRRDYKAGYFTFDELPFFDPN